MDKEIQQILDIARKNGFSDESLNLIYIAYNQGLDSPKMAYDNALDEISKQPVDHGRKIAVFNQITEQIRKESKRRIEQIQEESYQQITQIKYDAFMHQRKMIRLAIMPCRYSEFRFVPRAPEM